MASPAMNWNKLIKFTTVLLYASSLHFANGQTEQSFTTLSWDDQDAPTQKQYLAYSESSTINPSRSRSSELDYVSIDETSTHSATTESVQEDSSTIVKNIRLTEAHGLAKVANLTPSSESTLGSNNIKRNVLTRTPQSRKETANFREEIKEPIASDIHTNNVLQAPESNAVNNDLHSQKVKKNNEEMKPKIKQRYDEKTGQLVVSDEHPCKRECQVGEAPMICYYHFYIEWYQTLSKACFDCPYNETDCFRPDCIPADGMNRPITVINRKMPGPAIEVCKNDRIIVDVQNGLMMEGTTIHWHGQHQRGTPYMDGTPYVTQCPILPEGTFRYQFNASHSGTHFWHSHAGMQRADGAAGALVIRVPRAHDRHAPLFDYDRAEHFMMITDWTHELSLASFTDHHHSSGDNKPPTLLINGLGRFRVFNESRSNESHPDKYMRAARFNVEQGYRYRFRVINAEFLNCPIELSVDNHNITIVASDGYDLQPVTATSLVTYAGERFDFILEANAEIDNYWIRFRGLMDCDERFTKAKQVAVLHYEGAMENEPPGDLTWEESHNEGLQINALNKGEEENETISISELRALDMDDDSLKPVADYQFYVSYDFYAKNNSHFHRSPYYGYYQVPNADDRLYTPQLNHITMEIPSSPLLVNRPSSDHFCNASSVASSCKNDFCECPHVLSVKTGSVVEIIMVDEGVTFDANHPFHLHGHSFRVVALRRLASEITIEEVKAYDEAGLLKRNLKRAPIKDTVTVPDGGYTVLRFKADNPGYWLFHCHIEFHAEVGMALVFKVGEHEEMAPVPPNFPTCGDYVPDNMLEFATTNNPSKDDGHHISITHWWPVVYFNSTSSANLPSTPVSLFIAILFSLLSWWVSFT